MNSTTLQALRRLLFFSLSEAALLVAAGAVRAKGVSERVWQQWEDGEESIPADVAEHMNRLAKWRRMAIEAAVDQIAAARASLPADAELDISLIWYESMDDWLTLAGRDPVLFRPQQSVVAELMERHDSIRLVRFDPPAYSAWLGNQTDDESMRSQWAASIDD
jgi:hypothetical protein